ncbi:hypothetical protein WS67_08425 [Burkholderia singularis]|uniref:Uncharacterized protein n=1 Tax=Burkholderia singularis TaxID=1503053 RepID=A0A103E5M0_9BURK|nr:hypothetical protein WS67_08425 [Burkholderia singularis]
MTNHAKVRPLVFELFRDIFALWLELPAAIGAVRRRAGGWALHAQGDPATVAARVSTARQLRCSSHSHTGRNFAGLQVFQPQFKLFDPAIPLLRFPVELYLAQLCDRQLQMC